ncbi:MAG: hypothetical protein HY720_21375 [Planctomycetes bacterium]|nr:hypothetical protein [Planctomycetota bacterium]
MEASVVDDRGLGPAVERADRRGNVRVVVGEARRNRDPEVAVGLDEVRPIGVLAVPQAARREGIDELLDVEVGE